MANLLFIDDDHEISAINEKYFSKLGYSVRTASNAKQGIKLVKEFQPDCIVLDVMMPEVNGLEACKHIRTFSSAPIIFLSGKTHEDDKINGLMIGANDYLTKPYSFRELSARIQVQLRSNHQSINNSILSCPPLTLDVASHKAYYNKEEIPLSKREYELLYLLISAPNQTVSFEEIGKHMFTYYSEDDRRTIMVTASRLRKKIDDYTGLENVIETVWSKGYKYIMK